ncbi:hypothetical protein AC578_5370 [Pseudocercospora eumusae]|uniref:BHLH domain-containing protein n=1 Tax=Pseudocercospora eumusae TaxID=321146 RepID=A0A139HJY7_9PEZI|nr:hypothetical protein AC578_5370 [Pseudocercospora eumusae]
MDENLQLRQQQQSQQNFDMAQVLSARHFPIGGDESFNFGDPGFLEQQPQDRPLLDNSEQNMLNNFWDHPDEFKDTGKAPTMPFGYMPSQDANANASASASASANANANAAATSASLRSSHAKSHARSAHANTNNRNTENGGNGSQQQYNANVTGEDINAASLIHNIRNNSSSSSTSGASAFTLSNPGDFSTIGSWGSFLNPMTIDMSGHLANLTMTYTHNWNNAHAFNSQRQQPTGATYADMGSQLMHANMASRYHPQYTQNLTGWQGPGHAAQYAPPHNQGRNQSAAFGSDTSFAGGHFRSANGAANHDNKAGNLLGVPGAPQAAAPTQQSASNFTIMQQSPTTPAGQPWSGQARISNGTGRKRGRSQAEEDWQQGQFAVKQEQGYNDYAGGSAGHKRRISAFGAQAFSGIPMAHVSNSPEMGDDEARRRGILSKKKENLTDQQKRFNHIQSEKKRRELINTGYNTLNVLVPALAQGKSGLSRSECLTEVNMYLQTLSQGNAEILRQLGLPADALAGVNRDGFTNITGQAPQNQPQSQQQAPTQPQPQAQPAAS